MLTPKTLLCISGIIVCTAPGAACCAVKSMSQGSTFKFLNNAGLQPTVAAIKAGKDICLANKETLIAGGPYVLPLAAEHNVRLLPADSEHSAIFQCIQGLPEDGLRRIILTASGEAFHPFPWLADAGWFWRSGRSAAACRGTAASSGADVLARTVS